MAPPACAPTRDGELCVSADVATVRSRSISRSRSNQPTDPNAPPDPPLAYPVDGRGRRKCALGSVAEELRCVGKARLCVYDDGRQLGCDKLPFVRTPFDAQKRA